MILLVLRFLLNYFIVVQIISQKLPLHMLVSFTVKKVFSNSFFLFPNEIMMQCLQKGRALYLSSVNARVKTDCIRKKLQFFSLHLTTTI